MHRIDGNDHVGNLFVEYDEGTGQPATQVTAAWMNALQEEIATVIEDAGISLNKPQNDQLAAAIPLLANPNEWHYKNHLINAEFVIAQKGLGGKNAPDSEVYGYDRWSSIGDDSGGSGNVLMTRFDFTPGQADVPWNPRHFMQFRVTANPTIAAACRSMQRIEDVTILSGKTVTFNCYAKHSSGTGSVTVRLVQNFGSGGSPSADVEVDTFAMPATVSDTWERFEHQFVIPSVSGKTLGSNDDHHLVLEIVHDVGSLSRVDIAVPQLELGSAATAFQRRHDALEYDLCRRFYENSNQNEIPITAGWSRTAGTNADDETNKSCPLFEWYFLTEKRATPAVVWYDNNSTVDKLHWGSGSSTTVDSTTGTQKDRTGFPVFTASVTGLGGDHISGQWSADAELYE